MRVIIAGSGRLGVSVMQPLLDSEHEVVGLLHNGRAVPPKERRRFIWKARFQPPSTNVLSLALRRRVPVIWLDDMDPEALSPVRDLDPDLIITAGFSIILKKALLEVPNVGCINVHSSLLPRHRGACPFAHCILTKDTKTGVTFHVTDEGIDTGPILAQDAFPIGPMDTSLTVYDQCCDMARGQVLDVVDEIELHGLRTVPQIETEATYEARVTHESVEVDWRQPAEDVERLVRAAAAYHYAWFKHRGRVIRVTRATYDPRPVLAGPGTVLEVAPYPIVATGYGRLIIHAAHINHPIPWSWPAPWARPKPAELL